MKAMCVWLHQVAVVASHEVVSRNSGFHVPLPPSEVSSITATYVLASKLGTVACEHPSTVIVRRSHAFCQVGQIPRQHVTDCCSCGWQDTRARQTHHEGPGVGALVP